MTHSLFPLSSSRHKLQVQAKRRGIWGKEAVVRAGEGGEGRRRDNEEMRVRVGRKRRMGTGVQERERDEGLSEETHNGDKGGRGDQ